MNKKFLLFLIPLILILIFFIGKNKEGFNNDERILALGRYNMNPNDATRFNKCKNLRGKMFNPYGPGNILFSDLVEPNNNENPDPTNSNPNALEVQADKIEANFKRQCTGAETDSSNPLTNEGHLNHRGALRVKNSRNRSVQAWAKDHNRLRYSIPIKNIERIDRNKLTDSYNPIMGDPNSLSPEIVKQQQGKSSKWKWFKDGKLEKSSAINLPNFNLQGNTNYKVRDWDEIHPYDAARENREVRRASDNYYMDFAQSEVPTRSLPNPNNSSEAVQNIIANWGKNYGKNPDMKKTTDGEIYSVTGNSVEDEPPLNQIYEGTKAFNGVPRRILNMRSSGCQQTGTVQKPGQKVDVIPLKKVYDSYPEADIAKNNSGKLFNKFIRNINIKTLEDLEKHQYKRKIIPGPPRTEKGDFYTKNHRVEDGNVTLKGISDCRPNQKCVGKEIVQMYGKPYSSSGQQGFNRATKKGTKVLPSSGFDATQMVNPDGDLKNDSKAHYPIEAVQEKKCPEPIKHRYYYVKPGLPQFSEWYIGEVGGSFSKDLEGVIKNGPNKECMQCSNPGGCRYPNETGGKYSADYFEFQKCEDGKDRICKKCKTCKMGMEVVESDCGEGGGANDRSCCACSECPDGTYKVYGCDKPNSFFDTECKPMSKCRGFKPEQSKLDKLMNDKPLYGRNNLNTYDSDPGEGNRMYMIRPGLKGGYADRDKIDPVTGKTLKNPFFGRDTMCGKCDTCPPGWIHLRGCMGVNDDENTVCQRTIDKASYLAKNFTPPKGKFYSKDKISEEIDRLNAQIQERDEEKRQIIIAQNNEIKNDPNKMRTMKLININDPANFPDPLPVLSDEYLKKIGFVDCSICPGETKHRDPNNPGCEGDKDTICKPHTPCYDFQYISKKGDSFNDQQCSSCRCPQPDYYGIPDCTQTATDENGIIVPNGCKRKIDCRPGEYISEDPGVYGDTTKPRECAKCKTCGYGTFSIKGGCRPGGATDTVCKEWKVCDKKSMMVIEPGTSTQDTICKCIDGYELPKDKVTGKVNLDANYCEPILGKCHTNPCHPKANCFDNFTDDGRYINTVCECDINKGFIQTESKGFGPDGCFSVPGKHSHEIKTPAASYGELPEKFAKVLTHLDGDYHKRKTGKHLHKSSPLKVDDEGEVIQPENN